MSWKYPVIILMLCAFTTCGITAEGQVELTQSADIRLSPPIAQYASTLFADSAALSFLPGHPGSQVRYTLDGSDPRPASPVFEVKKYFTSSTLIKAASFHPDFQSSDFVEIDFVKVPEVLGVKSINLLTAPNVQYKGEGAASLIDLKKGGLNFRDPVWMGFSEGKAEIEIYFTAPRNVKKVIVSTMVDQGSWIFLPAKIVVETDAGRFDMLTDSPEAAAPEQLSYEGIHFGEVKTQRLRIRIESLAEIPGWHPGAGNIPWFFIDEIVVE
jgi:hypothetical protein